MKKILLLLFLLLGMSFFSCSEETPSVGLEYNVSEDKMTCLVSGIGECTDERIVIPNISPDGSIVVGIDENAFKDNDTIIEVIFPDSVTYIKENAFSECNKLAEITFSDNLKSISTNAFYGCGEITKIILPENLVDISAGAFMNCVDLTEIYLPATLQKIGAQAFYNTGYYNDEKNWSDDILYIDKYLIKACESIVGAYSIEGETLLIADSAFYNCKELTDIEISNTVVSIGSMSFYNCNLITSLYVPMSVKCIYAGAFWGCTNLTEITLPDCLMKIGEQAFYKTGYYVAEENWENEQLYLGKYLIRVKENASNVIIKDGTIGIADSALTNCVKCLSISIPQSVMSLGVDVFSGIDKAEVCFSGTVAQWEKIVLNSDGGIISIDRVVKCIDGEYEYKS